MHHEAYHFLKRVKLMYPDLFKGTRVLECGSLDINGDKYGSNRNLFESPKEYLGVDLGPGKGVDLVCKTHEIPKDKYEHFNVVLSTEMLEHDPWASRSVMTMIRCLKSKGALIITVAGATRPEHGTSTTNPKDSPFMAKTPYKDFYKGYTLQGFRRILQLDPMSDYGFEVRRNGMDIYFWGIKR